MLALQAWRMVGFASQYSLFATFISSQGIFILPHPLWNAAGTGAPSLLGFEQSPPQGELFCLVCLRAMISAVLWWECLWTGFVGSRGS